MKKMLMVFLMTASVQVAAKVGGATLKNKAQYSKVVTVNGMVCAFCANSLQKKFKKEKKVKNIAVDLESKKVMVEFKKGKRISDKKIKKMITASGFNVVSIRDFNSENTKKNFDAK